MTVLLLNLKYNVISVHYHHHIIILYNDVAVISSCKHCTHVGPVTHSMQQGAANTTDVSEALCRVHFTQERQRDA